MSELKEPRWAVISERGREARGLAYAEASALVQSLRGEKLSGLCIVTNAAAEHIPSAVKGNKKKPDGGIPGPAKRGARKRAT